eukprot:620857-Alexandrium_andersonii.AAC.1
MTREWAPVTRPQRSTTGHEVRSTAHGPLRSSGSHDSRPRSSPEVRVPKLGNSRKPQSTRLDSGRH